SSIVLSRIVGRWWIDTTCRSRKPCPSLRARANKNPISLPPSGFPINAALAAFVERPQAEEVTPDQIGADSKLRALPPIVNSSDESGNIIASRVLAFPNGRSRYPAPARHDVQSPVASQRTRHRDIAVTHRRGTQASWWRARGSK